MAEGPEADVLDEELARTRASGDRRRLGQCLVASGRAHMFGGETATARQRFLECLAVTSRTGESLVAEAQLGLGWAALADADYGAARSHLDQASRQAKAAPHVAPERSGSMVNGEEKPAAYEDASSEHLSRAQSQSPELYYRAIEMLGRRWSGAIVHSMLAGNVRFSEIRGTIPGVSDRLLSERLKELRNEGIVERRVVTRRHIEYHLTIKGRALGPAVRAIERWAQDWIEPN